MRETRHHINIGPPGTGKTTWLSRQIERASDKGHNITVISLTKSSAAEVAGRGLPIPQNQVGTLHSQCFRALKGVSIAESAKNAEKWNSAHPQLAITPVGEEGEDPQTEMESSLEGDKLLNQYQILRGRMLPKETWPEDVTAFEQRWEAWKEEEDLLDFTDLIVRCYEEIDTAPGQPDVLMIDEAQDMDRLEMALATKWGLNAGTLVVVGDPDQCQPPGTMLATTKGRVPIEEFNPARHTLLTWHTGRSHIEPQPGNFPIKCSTRPFRGDLVEVKTKEKSSRSTPDHIWLTRTQTVRLNIVWLTHTQKGWWARTQIQEILRAGQPHKPHRAWALTTEESADKARETAQSINQRLAKGTSPESIIERFKRDAGLPLLTEHNSSQALAGATISTRAVNLIPEMFSVPVPDGQDRVSWHAISDIKRIPYEGPVYSFHIEPHKTYVADGILTHNCLYEWRGSDPRVLMAQEAGEHTRSVLKQSYRLSQKVHQKALNWINSCPNRDTVEYYPTQTVGAVRYLAATARQPEVILRDAEQYLEDGKSVMLIASCAYMLDDLIRAMREDARPFHNPLRARNGQWNPLSRRAAGTSTSQRILDFLHMSEYGHWNADQLRNWAGAVKLKETFAGERGIAKRLEELVDDDTSIDDEPCLSWDAIYNLLPEEAIDAALTGNVNWLAQRLNKARQQPARFPMEVVRQRGPESLRSEPLLQPGTINSVKGGESEIVYLFPDLSQAGQAQWNGTAQERAAIYRLFYVGMTRAKDTLVICQPFNQSEGPQFWYGD